MDFQKTLFTDLDDYEKANCDFGNYYRWIGGQEPIDGIKIDSVKFVNPNSVLVTISYFDIEPNKNKKYHWGKNHLSLIKIDDNWFIDKIDSWVNK
ncbi:hypothetical protein [Aureibacter tunicatorum]|uniref:Uncharacterized protein n=1 Tax=Aureibacter tunicatorum TaxID=866807 RepID=A0AAE4BTU7_9BACT|nr:hypothetical protein [Aureibacter tunicatorum]MDR6241091.1 hypothetical protein [Aureibacter tunicatorum]BDD03869.1 hypothetical protein AUTU_13520 [Aureibacter tunicatorum]